MVEITRSKGTLHGIKALIRDMGINPDNNFRFKEFGGPRTGRLSDQRAQKSKVLRALTFSGSFNTAAATLDAQGIPDNKPHFRTPGLLDSGTLRTADASVVVRVEPGVPLPGASPIFDRILTSGSWTYEGTYKIPSLASEGLSQPTTSSLVRLATSGTEDVALNDSLFVNLVAFSGPRRS